MGPEGVYLYTASTGELELFGPSGSPQHLAQVMPASSTTMTVAGSPNGQCWILSDTSWASGGTGTSKTLCRLRRRHRPVAPHHPDPGPRPATPPATGSCAWDSVGVLLGSDPTGVGGAGPFIGDGYTLSGVVRLDPLTGTVSAPLCARAGSATWPPTARWPA